MVWKRYLTLMSTPALLVLLLFISLLAFIAVAVAA